jgi:hypothetical protein
LDWVSKLVVVVGKCHLCYLLGIARLLRVLELELELLSHLLVFKQPKEEVKQVMDSEHQWVRMMVLYSISSLGCLAMCHELNNNNRRDSSSQRNRSLAPRQENLQRGGSSL